MDILEEIIAHKRIEIEQRKRFIQPRQMKDVFQVEA